MTENVIETGPLKGLLHELHLPSSVSYWPPAPLWWLTALLLVSLICWLTIYLCRKNKLRLFGRATKPVADSLALVTQQHLQQYYKQWQQDALASRYLEQANVLMKRYVLSHNKAQAAPNNENSADSNTDSSTQENTDYLPAQWHGNLWVEWMQQAAPTTLSQETKQGLAVDCYRSNATSAPLPIAQIHQQLLQWITDYDDQHYA